MQYIDMHTHIFPQKIASRALDKLSHSSGTLPFTDGTEEALLASMKKAGIKQSIILPVATSAEQVSKINDEVIALRDVRTEHGIISCGAMHPAFPTPDEELHRLRKAGVGNIKLHPTYMTTDFDDSHFVPLLHACVKYDMAVTIHAGIDIGFPGINRCSTKMVLNVLEQVPGLKLVLAHMGGWMGWDQVKKDLAGAPLYYDTSFSFGPLTPRPDVDASSLPKLMTDEEFVALCEVLGFDRILFGTDSPWTDQSKSVERLLSLPITQEQKEAILFKNAKRILDL